jgi:hypothetical protein
MNGSDSSRPRHSLLPPASLVACTAVVLLAVLQLPAERMPLSWSSVLLLVGAGLHGLRWQTRARWRTVAARLAVTGTIVAVLVGTTRIVGPLDRAGQVASVLIVASGFHFARRRGADVALVVFLGLCLYLVGQILRTHGGAGPTSVWTTLGLLTAMMTTLQLDAHWSARAGTRRPTEGRRGPTSASWSQGLRRGRITLGTLVLMLVLAGLIDRFAGGDGANGDVGESNRRAQNRVAGETGGPSASGRRSVGLGDDFELSGDDRGGEWELVLRSDVLCRVEALDREPLPASMRLRYDTFEVAELERWRRSPRRGSTRPATLLAPFRPHLVGTRTTATTPRRARIGVATDLRDRMLLPSGCWRIEAPVQLRHVPDLGTIQPQDEGALPPGSGYVVDWSPTSGHDIRGAAPVPEFVELGPSWQPHREFLLETLDELVGPGATALARVDLPRFLDRLADGLETRCGYRLAPPRGRHGIELLDFLDPDSDPNGFCMHFASSAAVLLRVAGVPCRVAVGLASGEATERPLVRLFGSRHAHAWVEILDAGGTWRTFDPTPRAATPFADVRGWPEETASERVGASVDAVLKGPLLRRLLGPDPARTAILLLMLVVVASTLPLVAGLARPRPRRIGEPRWVAVPATERKALRRLLGALDRAGARVTPGTSRDRALERLLAARPDADGHLLRRALSAYHLVRFGGGALDAPTRDVIEQATAELEKLAQRTDEG